MNGRGMEHRWMNEWESTVYQVTYFIPPPPSSPSSLFTPPPFPSLLHRTKQYMVIRRATAAYDIEQLGLAWVLDLNQPHNQCAEIFMNPRRPLRRWSFIKWVHRLNRTLGQLLQRNVVNLPLHVMWPTAKAEEAVGRGLTGLWRMFY